MSVLKFGFTAIDETRQKVLDELDNLVVLILGQVQGEPWVTIIDTVEKIAIDQQAALSGDPAGFVYQGRREVVFAGPTKLGHGTKFHDGFRPQGDEPGTDFGP